MNENYDKFTQKNYIHMNWHGAKINATYNKFTTNFDKSSPQAMKNFLKIKFLKIGNQTEKNSSFAREVKASKHNGGLRGLGSNPS